MKKIFLSVVMAVLLTILFTACGETPQHEGTVLIDQLGREVTLPENPERVVSSYYITTSLMVALEAEDKLVGIEMKPETRAIYQKAAPELLSLPQVGNSKTISVEECAKLDAQIVILPTRLKEFIEPLEKLGIAVIAVEPETQMQFLECIQLVGQAVGAEDRAKELLSYYDEKEQFTKDLLKNVTEKPQVLMLGTTKTDACSANMYQNDLILMAGGLNVAAELSGEKWATISPEQIVAWNPDYMMNVSYSEFGMEELSSDSALQTIKAVKDNNLYTFPSALEPWDYPTPSCVLGSLWLTNILHPELYDRESYLKDAQDFYKKFYGIDVTEEEIGAATKNE